MILPILIAAAAAATTPTAAPRAAAAPAAAKAPAQPAIAPKTETNCGVMTRAANADAKTPATYRDAPGLKVLGGPFQIALPTTDQPIVAVSCKRDTIVPGEGDGRVLWLLRKPLIINDASRSVVLQMNKGKFQVAPTKGTLTDAEKTATAQRLGMFQARFEAAVAQAQKAKAQGAASGAGAADKPMGKSTKADQ